MRAEPDLRISEYGLFFYQGMEKSPHFGAPSFVVLGFFCRLVGGDWRRFGRLHRIRHGGRDRNFHQPLQGYRLTKFLDRVHVERDLHQARERVGLLPFPAVLPDFFLEIVNTALDALDLGRDKPSIDLHCILVFQQGIVRANAHRGFAVVIVLDAENDSVRSFAQHRVRRDERRAGRDPTELVARITAGVSSFEPKAISARAGLEKCRGPKRRHQLLHDEVTVPQFVQQLTAPLPRLDRAGKRLPDDREGEDEDGEGDKQFQQGKTAGFRTADSEELWIEELRIPHSPFPIS